MCDFDRDAFRSLRASWPALGARCGWDARIPGGGGWEWDWLWREVNGTMFFQRRGPTYISSHAGVHLPARPPSPEADAGNGPVCDDGTTLSMFQSTTTAAIESGRRAPHVYDVSIVYSEAYAQPAIFFAAAHMGE